MDKKVSNFEFVLKFNDQQLARKLDDVEKSLKKGDTKHLISDIYECMKLATMDSISIATGTERMDANGYSPEFPKLIEALRDATLEITNTDKMPGMIYPFLNLINRQRNNDIHTQNEENSLYSDSEFSKNELVSSLSHLHDIMCWEFNTFIKEPDESPIYPNDFDETIYYDSEENNTNVESAPLGQVSYSQDDKQIGLNKLSIGDFIKNKDTEFYVPAYQRKYSWNRNNIDELFDGLAENMKRDLSSQYFGAVAITKNSESNKNIIRLIDGQQRVTTSLIFAKAVYDLLKVKYKVDEQQMPEELIETFKDNNAKNKLKNGTQIEQEQACLEKILDTDLNYSTFDSNRTMAKFKTTNSFKNYMAILDRIEEYIKQESVKDIDLSDVEILEQLFRYFYNYYQVAAISFNKDKDEEMQIFENLNSKGMDLTIFELIKNTLFLKIANEEYEKNEEKIVSLFNENINLDNSDKDDTNSDNTKEEKEFIFDYLAYKRRSTAGLAQTAKDLLSNFNSLLSEYKNMSYEKYKYVVEEMGKYVEIFKSIKYKTYEIKADHFLARFKDYLDIFDAKPALLPFLFFIVDTFSEGNYDPENKTFIIDKKYDVPLIDSILQVEKYIIWLMQVNGTGQSFMPLMIRLIRHVEKQINSGNVSLESIPDIVADFLSGKSTSYEEDKEIWNSNMPTNDEFRNAVENHKFYSNFVEIVLKRIDLYLLDPYKKGDKSLPFRDPSIEHIFPQKPEKDSWWWKNEMPNGMSDEDFLLKLENEKDKLGNLLILGKRENSKIKNKDLPEKQKQYENVPSAKLAFGAKDRNLLNIDSFSFDDIDKRTQVLANFLIDKVYK